MFAFSHLVLWAFGAINLLGTWGCMVLSIMLWNISQISFVVLHFFTSVSISLANISPSICSHSAFSPSYRLKLKCGLLRPVIFVVACPAEWWSLIRVVSETWSKVALSMCTWFISVFCEWSCPSVLLVSSSAFGGLRASIFSDYNSFPFPPDVLYVIFQWA